jgi:hypothetical protein
MRSSRASKDQQLCSGESGVLQRLKDFVPHDLRKHKAGHAVPRRQLTPEQIQGIRDRAAGWGKIVARRAFGPDGPGLDVDFDTMEPIARAAAAGLTEGALATGLEQQAQALGDTQPCPACGAPCPVRRAPPALAMPGAAVTRDEPACHCPACRRDFFPPAAPAAPG